jgi:hypothetical protein
MKSLTVLFAISLLFAASTALGADPGTCINGSCMRSGIFGTRPATQTTTTIVQPSVQGSSAATCGARTPKGSTPRGRFFPRLFRRWR